MEDIAMLKMQNAALSAQIIALTNEVSGIKKKLPSEIKMRKTIRSLFEEINTTFCSEHKSLLKAGRELATKFREVS